MQFSGVTICIINVLSFKRLSRPRYHTKDTKNLFCELDLLIQHNPSIELIIQYIISNHVSGSFGRGQRHQAWCFQLGCESQFCCISKQLLRQDRSFLVAEECTSGLLCAGHLSVTIYDHALSLSTSLQRKVEQKKSFVLWLFSCLPLHFSARNLLPYISNDKSNNITFASIAKLTQVQP